MNEYEIQQPSPEQIAFGVRGTHETLIETDPLFEVHHASLTELSESIEKREVSEEVRKILSDAELIAVIAKEKPLSSIGLEGLVDESDLSGLPLSQNERFLKNISTLEDILTELNIRYAFMDSNSDMWTRDSVNPPRGAEVWRQEEVLEVAQASGMFTDEEIASIEGTPEEFLVNRMRVGNKGYSSVYRIGTLYGYPLCDVRDNIEIQRIIEKYELPLSFDLKTLMDSSTDSSARSKIDKMSSEDIDTFTRLKKSMLNVQIGGVHGSVGWHTYNKDSEEVIDKVKSIKDTFDLQREMLGQAR